MTAGSLNTLLWVPFGIVALIAGLSYCVSGYKKGLWRALGNLGAVVLSAAASVWLAKWIAGMAAPEVAAVVPVEALLPAEYANEFTVAMIRALLPTLACVALSMTLFSLLMLIVTPILRGVLGLLLGKGLITKHTGLKWLGFVTGAATALVFTLCFLAPLYGSLAAMAPVAQLLVETVQLEEQEQAEVCVDVISDHMLVQIAGTDPVKLVYRELSQVTLDGKTYSLADLSDTVEAMLPFFREPQTPQTPDTPDPSQPADPDQGNTQLQELIEAMDMTVAQQMLEQLGEEKQTQITDALEKMGAQTLEEAKKLVEQMDVDEIMDLMDDLDLDWLKEMIPGTTE